MGRLERRQQKMRFHMIDSSHLASLQRTETKLLAHPPFLERLREQGRARAATWLAEHFDSVGRQSTIDVKKYFA
jgi:NTE family protein